MKLIVTVIFMMSVLSACNFKESLKEAGDSIQTGVQNVGDAAKELPADISEASNKVEADIKE